MVKQILRFPKIFFVYCIITYILLEVVSCLIERLKLNCCSDATDRGLELSFSVDYILGVLKFSFLSMVIFEASIMGYFVLLLNGKIPGNGDLCLAITEFLAGIVVQLFYFLLRNFVIRSLPRLEKSQILFTWFLVIIIMALQFNTMKLPAQRNICVTLLFSHFFWIGLPGVSIKNIKDFIKNKDFKSWLCNKVKRFISLDFLYVLSIVVVFLSIVIIENSSDNIFFMIFAAAGCGIGISLWWKHYQCKEGKQQ